MPVPVLLLLAAGAGAELLEVGFCDGEGNGFLSEQPADQLERWELPYDNGTHLVINWRNDRRVSGRNVTAYHVDVKTSLPVLNFFVGTFGGFPQDVCAPGGSKARNAVNVEGSAGTCVPYAKDSYNHPRLTAFEIPAALRKIASWDIVVTVRGYGAHAPVGAPASAAVPCQWWCHKYMRRARSAAHPPAEEAAAPDRGGSLLRRAGRLVRGWASSSSAAEVLAWARRGSAERAS